jgi:hypothetical protein
VRHFRPHLRIEVGDLLDEVDVSLLMADQRGKYTVIADPRILLVEG